jgi:hypothetical protein
LFFWNIFYGFVIMLNEAQKPETHTKTHTGMKKEPFPAREQLFFMCNLLCHLGNFPQVPFMGKFGRNSIFPASIFLGKNLGGTASPSPPC